ncbi:MAG: DNA-directed RNA polymerase subunit beta', partial [Acidimicrobiia bacterium]
SETTLGRVFINQALPEGFPFVDSVVIKADIRRLIETVIERYPRSAVAETLDGIKELGFNFATKTGLTIALDDVRTPADKAQILEEYEERAEKVQSLFQKGVVTDEERRQELIEIWTEATEKVTDAMKGGLKSERFNALDMMVGSGARGNMMQVRQIAGMRGLVANPKGDIIPRPIISNFREGLSVLEYFISTHGARKGLADTALRTADSGYLTRRLVDVSQEMIILELDCETDKGIVISVIDERGSKIRNLRSRIFGRALADDLKEGRALVATVDDEKLRAGTVLGTKELHAIEGADVESVRVRSPLTCDTRGGVCQACYGLSLATGKMVETGEAVGIMAAQSIGEPGTQLTMRTFHIGGAAARGKIEQSALETRTEG